VEARWRVRQVANVVNLSTPLGLALALAGRGTLRRGPDGLLVAHAVRLPAKAPAFTVGNGSWLRCRDASSYNIFEVRAGLPDGGYPNRRKVA
jgi:hypothetical protein